MLFSIVIATFNVEKYIKRSLDSIVDQSFDNVEVIVVDGNSCDGTVGIIKEHPVVSQWISEPDEGIYDAWNKGVSLSRGEWVIFLGADDYLKEDALRKLASVCFGNDNLDYVSGKVALIDEHGRHLRTIGEKWSWSKFRHGMNMAHPGSAHRRNIYDEVGLYGIKYRIVGDYELLLRKGAALKAGFVDAVLANMTVGGVSSMSRTALYERYIAKAEHRTVSPILNVLSLYYGYTKLYVKIWMLKLGLAKV